MEKEQETLNEEEKKLPTDDGLSEDETTEENEEESEEESEEDDSQDEPENDSVTIPKAELERLKSDNENYRKGIKEAKKKNFKLPTTSKPAEKQENVFDEPDTDKFLTKEDYYKGIERGAIDKAIVSPDMPKLDEHFDNVMLFYANRHGNTVEGYYKNIQDAYYLWEKSISSPKDEEKAKTKKDTAALAQEQGVGKGKKTDTTPQKKKSVIPKKKSMQEWYS